MKYHVSCKNHQILAKESLLQPKLSFPSVDPLTQKVCNYSLTIMLPPKVVRAEVKMTNFFVQHNLPLFIAADLGPLFRIIYSQTAKLLKRMQVAGQKPPAYLIMQLLHTLQVSIIVPIVNFHLLFFIALLVEAMYKMLCMCFVFSCAFFII